MAATKDTDNNIHTSDEPEKTLSESNSVVNMYQSNDPIVGISMQELNPNWNKKTSGHVKMQVKHPTTYLETLLHVLKGNFGSGLYAMGDAFKNAGLVLAPIATVVLGFICVHCQHSLLTGSGKMQKRVGLQVAPDFAGTMELCFSTGPQRLRKYSGIMRCVVNGCLCITQMGFCCVYFVFISTNLKKICDFYGLVADIHVHMVIAFVPILLSSLVRNLKFMTPISTLANIFMIVGVAIIFYFASSDIPPLSERQKVANWSQMPLFFGTVMYAFEAIGLVLPLKNEMKEPEKFQKTFGVLNVGMLIVISLYVIVGFIGYAKWGENVLGSLTLNLPEHNILSDVVQLIIILGIMFSYPLQFYVLADITWTGLREKYGPFRNPVTIELAWRSCLVVITFVLASVIPHLGQFISLVGAFSSTALCLLFPPMIELMIKSQEAEGLTCVIICKNTVIFAAGLLGLVTGTYESIHSIILAFQKDYL